MTRTEAEQPSAIPAWVSALSSEPLLVLDSRAGELINAYSRREDMLAAIASADQGRPEPPRYATRDGAAVITVSGPLLNFGDRDLSRFGYASYGWLSGSFLRAAADMAVNRAVIAFDSPGGMVSGIETVTSALRTLRAAKPVVAHVDGMAASAAYWLASQADEIVMTDLSEVGSIGVYTTHMDMSKLLERIGINVSLIASGRHKVEGNPFEPLSAEVRDTIAARIDDLRVAFAQEVAAGRPKLSVEAAMATEARMYRGRLRASDKAEAIEAGLADRLGLLESAIQTVPARVRTATGTKGVSMSGQNEGQPAANTGIPKAEHDAAVAAARTEGHAAGVTEGHTAGIAAEQERFAAILGSDAGKANLSVAVALALTGSSLEQATAVLAVTPKGAGNLSHLMNGQPDPDLGAGTRTNPGAASASLATKMAKRFGAGAQS